MSERAWGRTGLAAVGLAVLLTFWPSLGGEFLLWDDDENFLHNQSYRGLGWAQLRWMFTTAHMGPYIPLAWVTLGLDYLVWGMNPWGYHLTSVALHAANAVLLCAVARRLFAAGWPEASPAALVAGAAAAALSWALHPLRVESVAWITERRDVLMGCFALLTALAYLTAWRRGEGGRLHRGWLGLSVALFALALLSKSTVVGLPLVLLVLDAHPLRRIGGAPEGRRRRIVRLLVEKTGFFLVAGGFSVLALAVGMRRGMLTGLDTLDVVQRLAVSAYALAFYLWKTLVPWRLSPLYTLFLPVAPASPRYLAAAGAVIALTLAVLYLARRRPAPLVAWLGSILLVAPVLGLFHNGLQVAADRYTYMPAMAWGVLAGSGVAWVVEAARTGRITRPTLRVAGAGAVAVVVLLSSLTVRHERIWRDSLLLWQHAAWAEPESDIPVFYLGWTLAARGRGEEARAHFERALPRIPARLAGLRAEILIQIGILDRATGRPAEAEQRFREALVLDPGHPVALVRLGQALLDRDRPREAEAAFAEALRVTDQWPRYRIWGLRAAVADVPSRVPEIKGRLAFALGVALQHLDGREQAEEQYRLAVHLVPTHAAAWNNLGVLRAQAGRKREALEAFLHALDANPGHREACLNGRRLARELAADPAGLRACAPVS